MSPDYLTLHRAARAKGSGRFPARQVSDGIPVGRIARQVRAQYLAGELTDADTRRFESLHEWVWVTAPAEAKVGANILDQASWAQHYSALAGHLKTGPLDLSLVDADLHVWVERMRERHWAQQLTRHQYAVLQSTPRWHWGEQKRALPVRLRGWAQSTAHRNATKGDAIRAGRWERSTYRHLSALEPWAVRYGHVNVPLQRRLSGLRVGRWVSKMRRDYLFGKLTVAQAARLESFSQWSWRRAAR